MSDTYLNSMGKSWGKSIGQDIKNYNEARAIIQQAQLNAPKLSTGSANHKFFIKQAQKLARGKKPKALSSIQLMAYNHNNPNSKIHIYQKMHDPTMVWNSKTNMWQGKKVRQALKKYQKNNIAVAKNIKRSQALTNVSLQGDALNKEIPSVVKDIVQASQDWKVSGFGPISKNSSLLFVGRYIDPDTRKIKTIPKPKDTLVNPLSFAQNKKFLQAKILNSWNQFIKNQQKYQKLKRTDAVQWKTKQMQKITNGIQLARDPYNFWKRIQPMVLKVHSGLASAKSVSTQLINTVIFFIDQQKDPKKRLPIVWIASYIRDQQKSKKVVQNTQQLQTLTQYAYQWSDYVIIARDAYINKVQRLRNLSAKTIQSQKKYDSLIKQIYSAAASLDFTSGKKLAPLIKRLVKAQAVPSLQATGASVKQSVQQMKQINRLLSRPLNYGQSSSEVLAGQATKLLQDLNNNRKTSLMTMSKNLYQQTAPNRNSLFPQPVVKTPKLQVSLGQYQQHDPTYAFSPQYLNQLEQQKRAQYQTKLAQLKKDPYAVFNKFGNMSSNPMNKSFMSYRTSGPNPNTTLGKNTQQNSKTNLIPTLVPKQGKITKQKTSLQQLAKKSRILARKKKNILKQSQMMNRSMANNYQMGNNAVANNQATPMQDQQDSEQQPQFSYKGSFANQQLGQLVSLVLATQSDEVIEQAGRILRYPQARIFQDALEDINYIPQQTDLIQKLTLLRDVFNNNLQLTRAQIRQIINAQNRGTNVSGLSALDAIPDNIGQAQSFIDVNQVPAGNSFVNLDLSGISGKRSVLSKQAKKRKK